MPIRLFAEFGRASPRAMPASFPRDRFGTFLWELTATTDSPRGQESLFHFAHGGLPDANGLGGGGKTAELPINVWPRAV
jgi:hypothetical protein